MPEQLIEVVGAVIFDEKTESFYLGQRSEFKRHPLKWEFIGGKIDPGEDFLEATQREFEEEAGLPIRARKVLGSIVYDYGEPIGLVRVHFVQCNLFRGEPKIDPQVYQQCLWIPRSDLITLDWIEADKGFALSLAKNEVKY